MPRFTNVLLLLLVVAGTWTTGVASPAGQLAAPNPAAGVVDQLSYSGNACGPAALLTAFGQASPRWQELVTGLPANNDKSRLGYLIRTYGHRRSRFLDDRPRWQGRMGISLVDLTDVANELRGTRRLPELEWEVLLPRKGESGQRLVRRAHSHLAKSLRRGLPPVVGLQRLANRRIGDHQSWVTVYGHFIVVTSVPQKLSRGSESIPFQYADPWGGVVRQGRLLLETSHGFTAVVAQVPGARVGSQFVRRGEQSVVILSSGLGDF